MEKSYYKEYYHLERNHWWFLARAEILQAMLKKHLSANGGGSLKILNVGAATGGTSEWLEAYGAVTSLEYDEDCVQFLREETSIEAIQGSLTDLPFPDDAFDAVCCFDVLEHLEDDQKGMQELYRVASPGGLVFLTVPAFMSLWSEHDVVNHHYRRYSMKELMGVVKKAPFAVLQKSYFNFFLFTPIWLVRLFNRWVPLKRKSDSSSGSDFDIQSGSGWTNRLLYAIFSAEKPLLQTNLPLPFGVSILAVLKKPS